jgi:hypothetical protein
MPKSLQELAREYPDDWAKWNKKDDAVKADANCPPPAAEPSDVANNIASTLQAAGVKSCSTDQTSTQFSAQMQGSIMGMMQGNASVQASGNHTATVGCEQVSAISNAYKQTVNNITCTIKNNTNNITNSQQGVNSIRLESGRDIIVKCDGCTDPACASNTGGGLTFRQKINMKMMSSIQLSSSDVKSIANNTQAVCQGIAKVAMDSTSGLGATAQGQKSIQEATNTISQQNFNEAVTNAVNNINVTQNADNSITIKAGRDIFLTGKQCTFDQDTALEIIANAIISDVVQSTMENVAAAINTNDNTAEAKAVNTGAESLAVVAAPPQTSNPLYGLGPIAQMGMIAAIIVAVLGVAAVGMKGTGTLGKVAESKIQADSKIMSQALKANPEQAMGIINAVKGQNVKIPGKVGKALKADKVKPGTNSDESQPGSVTANFGFVKSVPVFGWIIIAFVIVLMLGALASMALRYSKL